MAYVLGFTLKSLVKRSVQIIEPCPEQNTVRNSRGNMCGLIVVELWDVLACWWIPDSVYGH